MLFSYEDDWPLFRADSLWRIMAGAVKDSIGAAVCTVNSPAGVRQGLSVFTEWKVCSVRPEPVEGQPGGSTSLS